MQIRPFLAGDLEVIREITVEAFDGVSIDQGIEQKYGIINSHDWKWRKGRHIDEDVKRNSKGIFIVEIDGVIVGLISTQQDTEAGIGLIHNIAFRPEYRGKGLGRKLIHYALDLFRENGLTHAKIETLIQNEIGGHLYRSIGFQEVAQQTHFVADLREGRDDER